MKYLSIAIIAALSFLSCSTKETVIDLSQAALIPKPVEVISTHQTFELQKSANICIESGSIEMKRIAESLAAALRSFTGFDIPVTVTTNRSPGNIYFVSIENEKLNAEGYRVEIDADKIVVKAATSAGFFRGVQTIRQLFPIENGNNADGRGPYKISTGTINDFPEYEFRSAMLDVSRHFFGVPDVKRYIDLLALYKFNYLHLHLSDDQGWRIEIKSWPNLTTYGSTTQVGGGKGGFYTQEQFKEIVQYAGERYITIIPEIDMPGHTNAALASYPELNCNGKAPAMYTGIDVGFSSLCTSKEITYKFIDDVVRELASMTPGAYIHIGGDESHATKKEDYIPFIERVQGIVQKHGKVMIGWEEVAQANLPADVIVQYWSNEDHATEAVKKGHKIIMSPATKTYLDMKYDSTTRIGLSWAAVVEVDSGYQWEPATQVKGISRESIFGLEAPLWTETVTNIDDIEYLAFPRIIGIAELAWSPAQGRSWDEYQVRLARHAKRLEALKVDFYRSPKVTWE